MNNILEYLQKKKITASKTWVSLYDMTHNGDDCVCYVWFVNGNNTPVVIDNHVINGYILHTCSSQEEALDYFGLTLSNFAGENEKDCIPDKLYEISELIRSKTGESVEVHQLIAAITTKKTNMAAIMFQTKESIDNIADNNTNGRASEDFVTSKTFLDLR